MAKLLSWRWLRILLTTFVALFGALGLGQPVAEDVFPGEHWNKMSDSGLPEWSQHRLAEADHFAANLGTDAYLVVQHGLMVHSFGDISRPMNLASVRKSVLSILIGKAVERGQMTLQQTLAELNIHDRGGLSEQERSATVRQLLMSRSGVYHEAAYETAGEKKDRPPRGSHAPGEFWYYNNWDFNTLGAIYQLCTGQSVFAGLQAELAEPLRLQDFNLQQNTEYVSEGESDFPAYLIYLSARDLARIGVLMARQGRWNEHQLVPASWVKESTTAYSDTHEGEQGFGYMWWVAQKVWPFWQKSPGEVFFAWGNDGQFLVVDPQRDLVIVHRVDTGKPEHSNIRPEHFGGLLQRILAAVPVE